MVFNVARGRITVDPKTLMVKELRDIYEEDKSTTKEKAIEILTFVHLASRIDEEAPFFTAREDEVRHLAAQNAFRTTKLEDVHKYDNVIKAYQKAYQSPESRFITVYNDKIDQCHDVIKNTNVVIKENINEKTGAVTYTSNFPIIDKIMTQMNSILDTKEKIELRIRKQSAKDSKVRGQRDPSFLEKNFNQ